MDKHELSNNVIAFSYKVSPQLYAGGFLLFYPPEADCYLLFAFWFEVTQYSVRGMQDDYYEQRTMNLSYAIR